MALNVVWLAYVIRDSNRVSTSLLISIKLGFRTKKTKKTRRFVVSPMTVVLNKYNIEILIKKILTKYCFH